MSLNEVAAWPVSIVCVSDRRLVDLVTGKIRTNRSTKMTIFGCADAHGVIVYNGIGMDDSGATPSDWLFELEAQEKVFGKGLDELLCRVAADLETRLQKIRAKYESKKARHTFVFAAWREGSSCLYGVSNYERVDNDEELIEGREIVTISEWLSTPKSQIRILTTGMRPPTADVHAIAEVIKQDPLNLSRVIARCVKSVRGVAFRRGIAKGTVGAAAQWAAIGPAREQVRCGLDVVGGRIAQETPNLINIGAQVYIGGTMSAQIGGPGMLIKDTFAGNESARGIARYDPSKKAAVFSEPQCGVCGAPLPASHRFCEVCTGDKHRKKSKHAPHHLRPA